MDSCKFQALSSRQLNYRGFSLNILKAFDQKTDHRRLYRRLGVCAVNIKADGGFYQLNMFIDYDSLAREKQLQGAIGERIAEKEVLYKVKQELCEDDLAELNRTR